MNLTPFTVMNKDDNNAWHSFVLGHVIAHAGLTQVSVDNGFAIPHFDYSEIESWQTDWLIQHQSEHAAINNQLTNAGPMPDLSVADFKTQPGFDSWHDLHRALHQAQTQLLGL